MDWLRHVDNARTIKCLMQKAAPRCANWWEVNSYMMDAKWRLTGNTCWLNSAVKACSSRSLIWLKRMPDLRGRAEELHLDDQLVTLQKSNQIHQPPSPSRHLWTLVRLSDNSLVLRKHLSLLGGVLTVCLRHTRCRILASMEDVSIE